MFYQVAERRMHAVRWVLTLGWLLLIISLFYDPLSPYLTQPENTWSPFALDPRLFDPDRCAEVVTVQGECIDPSQIRPYPIGTVVFWSLTIPTGVMLLMVFGHELWRRICPLSFLSQIPRAMGWQRQRKKVNPRTGAVRSELAKMSKDSWMARNHLYFQFGFLCVGLCLRILFINADRYFLGSFLLLTIAAAITVGYLYAGKSWCQYFCPMAPVQSVYTGPRALLGSKAHEDPSQKVTQSMCRTTTTEGKEKSACVGCNSPCIDIDAERNYWESFNQPGRKFAQYGYVGLVLGFYLYYFFYSGTLGYYYSGVWNHATNHLEELFAPGFYIAGNTIPIPKIIAVPLTIAVFVFASYFILLGFEKWYRRYRSKIGHPISQQQAQHHTFALSTFLVFNIYFLFGGRPILKTFHPAIETLFSTIVVIVSTLWLYRTLSRSADTYNRESIASSLRRQLGKLQVNFSKFLDGRSMEDLKPDEVYVLAKILPNFSKETSLQIYKGVLREMLEQGNVQADTSVERLEQIRLELGLKEDDHFDIITELGVEDPDLLDPTKHRSRENQLRLQSFCEALELQLLDCLERGMSLVEAMERNRKQIRALRQEYGITAEEQEGVLAQIADTNNKLVDKANVLLDKLQALNDRDRALEREEKGDDGAIFTLLRSIGIQNKQQIVVEQLFNILEAIGPDRDAERIARSVGRLAPTAVEKLLAGDLENTPWQPRFEEAIVAWLQQPGSDATAEMPPSELSVVEALEALLQELDPLVRSSALYALDRVNPGRASERAGQLLASDRPHWLTTETARRLLNEREDRSQTAPVLVLHVTEGGKTREFAFQQSAVLVGRNATNDIVFTDPQVAGHHAVIYLDASGASIVLLGSDCAVRLDNRWVQRDRHPLHAGDTIRFGTAEEPAILVGWERHPGRVEAIESVGTLDKLLLLREVELFASVRPEALLELAQEAQMRIYAAGATVCQAGEPSDELYLLVDGEADVIVGEGDDRKVVNFVKAGETIGEMGVLTRQTRSASVVAKGDRIRILAVGSDSFEILLRKDAEVTTGLLLNTMGRLQRLTAQVKG